MAAPSSIAGVYSAIRQRNCETLPHHHPPQPLRRINQFFGSAFMSFMAVAYVPAFLEDRTSFAKERANGLYGPISFMISNFLIGLPFLCM